MKEKWNTRQTLIQRAQNPEDQTAWDDFVSYYKEFIKMVLYKSNIPLNDKEDLLQEILIRVWKGLPNYTINKNNTKFRSWFSILIRNTILIHIDKSKRKGRDKGVELKEEDLEKISENEIEKVIHDEWINYLTGKAMEKVKIYFSGHAIEVFSLSLQGNSGVQIAEKLGITKDTVFVLRNRVKKRLRQEVESLRQEFEICD